jgi:hypothetical protein
LKYVGAKIQDKKLEIVISGAFNNKQRVHFVGIIIVNMHGRTTIKRGYIF